MLTCVIYARVSGSEQKNTNISVPVQLKKCKEFALEKGYKVLGIFFDDGRSGSDERRKGLLDMIAFCQNHSVDKTLVLDTDRFARDEDIHFPVKILLRKCGTKIESVSQPMLDDSPEGQLLDTIIAGLNAFMPKLTGRKTSISLEEKAKIGWFPGPVPLGYFNAENPKVSNGLEKKITILDAEKATPIKRAFKLFAENRYTVESLSEQIYREGLRSKNGGKVSRSEMTSILRNIFYIGKFKSKGIIYHNAKHPRIIDDTTFLKCQRILDEHNNFADRKRKHKFLLNSYVFCDICNTPYTAEIHPNKQRSYYHCSVRISKHSNRHQNIETYVLENMVAELFKKITLPQAVISKILEKAREKLSGVHSGIDEKRRILALRQQKLEQRQQTLETKLLDGIVNDETYQRQKGPIEDELNQITSDLILLSDDRKENIKVFEDLVQLTRSIYQTYIKADFNHKRLWLSLFFDRITVKDREIKKAVPTKLFVSLLDYQNVATQPALTGSVINSKGWLPGSDSNGQPTPYTDLLIT